ncbi:hypothetical protein DVH02_05295 [Streptomyces corynorhini]|uniref:Uncharacterized protein n=1 Tax=Streptomyces corynorhini TaxID=2282652 RepID=A0A370BHP0_9ACTN|nr:hypothetical protein DVH02_05295 [Streptomyces corynorhini]
MPVQVRPAQLDARWSKGRTRRLHTDLGSSMCRCATWVASQGPGGRLHPPGPLLCAAFCGLLRPAAAFCGRCAALLRPSLRGPHCR